MFCNLQCTPDVLAVLVPCVSGCRTEAAAAQIRMYQAPVAAAATVTAAMKAAAAVTADSGSSNGRETLLQPWPSLHLLPCRCR